MPAHCTSTGKSLLALLADEEIIRRYPAEQLTRLTSRSIGTRTDLLAELSSVRRLGFATSREESEDGVSSLSVALTAERPAQWPSTCPCHKAGCQPGGDLSCWRRCAGPPPTSRPGCRDITLGHD